MIPSFISKDDLEAAVLYKLYFAAHGASGEIIAQQLANMFEPSMPLTRVRLALDALYENSQVNWRQGGGDHLFYSITNSGIMSVEKNLYKKDSFLRNYAENGDLFLVDRTAPASNRIVRFDDNQPEAREIARGIIEAKESVRGANSEEIDEGERQRVLSGLEAAETLWNSANFRVVQLKIGVLMAVEDAGELLRATAKATSIDLLVEAIRSFARHVLKIDLDA